LNLGKYVEPERFAGLNASRFYTTVKNGTREYAIFAAVGHRKGQTPILRKIIGALGPWAISTFAAFPFLEDGFNYNARLLFDFTDCLALQRL
jgi:hypothetical protein